jgi:hypothetical protein
MSLVFVDCEAQGACPAAGVGYLTEFGAVTLGRESFYGRVRKESGLSPTPARSVGEHERAVFVAFDAWLREVVREGRPVFVSDNPAFDWQWINDGFWRTLGRNPFGHSARRIGDFYAGLCGDWGRTQQWKRLRRTKHTHHPVDDAMGNAEAWMRLMQGER